MNIFKKPATKQIAKLNGTPRWNWMRRIICTCFLSIHCPHVPTLRCKDEPEPFAQAPHTFVDKRAQSDGRTRFAGPTKMLSASGVQPFALAFSVIFSRRNVFGDKVHLIAKPEVRANKKVCGGSWWKMVEGFRAFALSWLPGLFLVRIIFFWGCTFRESLFCSCCSFCRCCFWSLLLAFADCAACIAFVVFAVCVVN